MNIQSAKPIISLIIPSLNEEKFLPKLLKTLTDQTCTQYEVIIVDGQSDDKTIARCKPFLKTIPLTILASPKRGLPYQRNYGARHAKGEWLVFSDADNLFFPYSMERLCRYGKNPNINFFTTWVSPDSDSPNETIISAFSNATIEAGLILKRPFSPGPLTAIRSTVFRAVGGYDETATWGEDMEFSTRVCKHGYTLDVLRESLYVWSMRGLRREGKLKVLVQFARASIYSLVTNKALTNMSNYIMGGHLYETPKATEPSGIKRFEMKLQSLIKEFFE